jgi:hypothetical protein
MIEAQPDLLQKAEQPLFCLFDHFFLSPLSMPAWCSTLLKKWKIERANDP